VDACPEVFAGSATGATPPDHPIVDVAGTEPIVE
jgi:hypothetical protein